MSLSEKELEKEWNTIKDFKKKLRDEGFEDKAILSDNQMRMVSDTIKNSKRLTYTPEEELRHIEGLLELPFRHLEEFVVIPKRGSEKCRCGRTPSALEVVQAAVKRRIHSKRLMRDTLLGIRNIFEIAEDGRQGKCISCGRPKNIASYLTGGYAYA